MSLLAGTLNTEFAQAAIVKAKRDTGEYKIPAAILSQNDSADLQKLARGIFTLARKGVIRVTNFGVEIMDEARYTFSTYEERATLRAIKKVYNQTGAQLGGIIFLHQVNKIAPKEVNVEDALQLLGITVNLWDVGGIIRVTESLKRMLKPV